jgi:hypothetical protein
VMGCFGYRRINDNGERVINMCLEHELFVPNTWFKHKRNHMYIWSRGKQRNIIDLVIYDKRLKGLVNDTRVYRGSECGSYHILAVSCVNAGNKMEIK